MVLDISSDMLISEGSDLRSGQRKRRRAGGGEVGAARGERLVAQETRPAKRRGR